jgi:hypothetical protein
MASVKALIYGRAKSNGQRAEEALCVELFVCPQPGRRVQCVVKNIRNIKLTATVRQ